MWLDRFLPTREPKQLLKTPTLVQVRSPRFHLDLPVSFVADGRTYQGQCLNVSDSGLLAKCDSVPEIWTDGQLGLEAGEHYLHINARVARVQGNDVGFVFSLTTENDLVAIGVSISSVSHRPLTFND